MIWDFSLEIIKDSSEMLIIPKNFLEHLEIHVDS